MRVPHNRRFRVAHPVPTLEDFVVLIDPLKQPGGTSLIVEVRGADHIGDEGVDPTLYDPLTSDNEATRGTSSRCLI